MLAVGWTFAASISLVAQAVLGFWMLQSSRPTLYRILIILFALVSSFVCFFSLLRPPTQDYYTFVASLPTFVFVKLLHAATNGPTLKTQFAVTSLPRALVFFLLPPSLMFGQHSASRLKSLLFLARGLAQMFGVKFFVFCLSHYFPGGINGVPQLLQYYLQGVIFVVLAGVGSDLFISAPASLIGREMVECNDLAIASTSMRDFWRRHSKNIGFHLRKAIYEPLSSSREGLIAVFAFNALLHIFWFHPMCSNGEIGWHYLILLVLPAVAMILEPRNNKFVQFIVLHVGFAVLGATNQYFGDKRSLSDFAVMLSGKKRD